MKAGTTASKYILLNELNTEYVSNIIFTFKSMFGSVKKTYPQNVILEDGRFRIDFTQEDTLVLSPNGAKMIVRCEAQINYLNGAVQKSTCDSWYMESTLATQLIVGNQSDGSGSDIIELALQEEVIVIDNGGGDLNIILSQYAKKTEIPTSLPASDVYAWAKAPTKPRYTANEVGALPNTTVIPSVEGFATEEYVNNKIPTVKDGQDGFSPIATVTKVGNISTFTVTDKNGTTSVNIFDGDGALNDTLFDFSMIRKFSVIGDSYSSGYINNRAVEEMQWGNLIAGKYGNSYLHLGKEGTDTKNWLTMEQGLSKMLVSEPQDLYFIALGINDENRYGLDYIGTIADITNYDNYADYADTFYGNYGKIIEQVLGHAPSAKIVLITIARAYNSVEQSYNNAIKNIANYYKIPYIDISADSFFASNSIYKTSMVAGHPIALVYSGMAKRISKLFEMCVENNISYFSDLYIQNSVAKTLASIRATKTTTNYIVGEELDTSDISVIATYSDNSTSNVTSSATINTSGVNMLTAGSYYIDISYAEGSVTKTAIIDITVAESGGENDSETPIGDITALLNSADYSITSDTTFTRNDAEIIDTNIKLFSKARDFTIYVDVATNEFAQSDYVFKLIKQASPYNGLALECINNTLLWSICGNGSSKQYATSYICKNTNLVGTWLIEFKNGICNRILKKTNTGYENLALNPNQNTANTLVTDCADISMKVGNIVGTINKFGIWLDKNMSDSELDVLFPVL